MCSQEYRNPRRLRILAWALTRPSMWAGCSRSRRSPCIFRKRSFRDRPSLSGSIRLHGISRIVSQSYSVSSAHRWHIGAFPRSPPRPSFPSFRIQFDFGRNFPHAISPMWPCRDCPQRVKNCEQGESPNSGGASLSGFTPFPPAVGALDRWKYYLPPASTGAGSRFDVARSSLHIQDRARDGANPP